MTTLLLPSDEVAKIRALKGLAYVLAVMILLDRHYPGRGFSPKEIAVIAGMDERTVAKQLQDLSVLDRAILTGAGYVLTQGGRAMFLSPAADIEVLALSPAACSPSDALQALSPELPSVEKAHQAQALQTLDLEAMDVPENTHTARALVVEVNTLTLLSQDTSTTTYLETQTARDLTIPQVFGKSHILFGESVLVRKGLTVSSALAIFAHVYAQKDSFHKPARVAFAMMRDSKEPREDFQKDPWKHLPAEYLEALNVARYQCNLCGAGELFQGSEALEAHLQAAHPVQVEPVEELAVPDVGSDGTQLVPGTPHTPASAWQAVLEQLKMDMHRAPFDTWVKDTAAVRFTGRKLVVGARNSYTRDWLESRLRIAAERLLVGILCQSVDVEFIVSQPVGELED